MKRLLIYRAQNGTLCPHAEIAYRAVRAFAESVLIDQTNEALYHALEAALCNDWDELLLMTDDLLGPVDSDRLQQMFATMAERDTDAWGLCRGFSLENSPEDFQQQLPPVGTTFLALRSSILRSTAFGVLLQSQPEDFAAAVNVLIANEGFSYQSVIPYSRSTLSGLDPLQTLPYSAVAIYGCPFVDIRCFTLPHAKLLETSMGEEPERLMRHLQEKTAYDTNVIWDWILSGCFDLNVVRNLGLMTCIPSAPSEQHTPVETGKCCLVMHLYYADLGAESLHYASSMPAEADIYINTVSEENKAYFTELFAALPNRVEIRVTENRGRDMGCLLIGMKDVLPRYDICCFYHDKKSSFNSVPSVGRSFAYLASESMLASKGYVERILHHFDSEPRLGVICCMVPHHGDYYGVSAHFWDHNFDKAQALLERLEVSVPINPDASIPAAWGNIFWFRPAALKPLTDYPWTYADFPSEPYPVDGSVAHAIERVHCLVAQSQGYYSRIAAPDHLAGLMTMNFQMFMQDYITVLDKAKVLGQHQGTICAFSSAVRVMQARNNSVVRKTVKRVLGEKITQCLKKAIQR